MTIEQPNRKRFYHSITDAIKFLNSDANCYYYGKDPEYEELMKLLLDYRSKIKHAGVWYEIELGDNYGMFQYGDCKYCDGEYTTLTFQSVESGNCGFMVGDNNDYPVRWYQMSDNELEICRWDERVHRIIFWNRTKDDVIINVDGRKQKIAPGKGEWFIHRKLYPEPRLRRNGNE